MSGDASVTLPFADGEYRFTCRIGQLREIQESVNKWRVAIGAPMIGPMTLLNSIRDNDAWPHDVREVLRISLIGGGKTPVEATVLLKRYFDERPPLENYSVAHLVLAAGFIGLPDDPVGKDQAGETTTEAQTTASSSPRSMEPALSLDGLHEKSTMPASGNLPPGSMPSIEPTAETTHRQTP